MILYLSVIACEIKSSNSFPCNFEQMYVLYQGPLFNQSGWLLFSVSYFISLLDQIIHDIPTWCNIAFNKNLVIISSIVEFIKYKPVSLLQLIHLISIISTTFPSSSSLLSNKRNWNMENTVNNEVISPLFGFRIFAVCSTTVIKGNHWIVSFIEFGQYKLLSWQSIYFSSEGLYSLSPIFFHTLQHQYWVSIIESMQDDLYLSTRDQHINWRCY